MAAKALGIALLLLIPAQLPAQTSDVSGDATPGVMLVAKDDGPFLAVLPVALPSYDVLLRDIDDSVLVTVEYIPVLWEGRRGCSRLDVCLDLTPAVPPVADPEPPRSGTPAELLLGAFSSAADRLAATTRVGFSLGYAFKP